MSYFKRLSYYSHEQLHPGSRLFLSLIIALFVMLLLNLTYNVSGLSIVLIIPTLSPFFLLLYYRISDEFKDYETDKKFFPDRPIPSGRVHLSDLKSLLVILSVVGIVLNLLFPYALKEYLAAWIFTVLMGRWFFMEKWIAQNRLLAFFTHAPVGAFLYWYVITFFENYYQVSLEFEAVASLIAFFVVPGLTWEILRKTFLSKDEIPGYQTYSSMLGFKGSLSCALLLIIITAMNNYFLINNFNVLSPLIIPLTFFNGLMFFGIVIQMFRPWIPNLRPVAEVYMGFHMIIPLAYLIWLNHV